MKIVTLEQKQKYQQYVLDLVISLKPQIIFVMVTLCLGLSLGLSNILHSGEFINVIINKLFSEFKEYRGVELFFKIFFQNSRATAIILYSGFILSITPTLATLINGLVIGHFIEKISHNISTFELLISLMPHGVFEIPVAIIALSIGTKFGLWPFSKNRKETIKTNFIYFSKYYFVVIVPLLLIAALIETIGIETQFFLNLR